MLGLHCSAGCSLAAASGGFSLVLRQLLTVVVFLAVGRGLWDSRASAVAAARGVSSCGSWALGTALEVVAQTRSCFTAHGILPYQGSNLRLLHFTTELPGKPFDNLKKKKNLSQTQGHCDFLQFFSRSLIAWALTFGSIIHLELTFAHGIE